LQIASLQGIAHRLKVCLSLISERRIDTGKMVRSFPVARDSGTIAARWPHRPTQGSAVVGGDRKHGFRKRRGAVATARGWKRRRLTIRLSSEKDLHTRNLPGYLQSDVLIGPAKINSSSGDFMPGHWSFSALHEATASALCRNSQPRYRRSCLRSNRPLPRSQPVLPWWL
jgi:hypothetical protein